MHILSSPLPPCPFGVQVISIEGLEDYLDNEPNTDSSEDPFGDDEDDVTVYMSLFLLPTVNNVRLF